MPAASVDRGVRKPDHVVMRELEGEAILLNLETETYFGLDEVGTRIWTELVASPDVERACEVLQEEFDVEPSVLRGDVERLAAELVETGLLEHRSVEDRDPPEPSPRVAREPGASQPSSVTRSVP